MTIFVRNIIGGVFAFFFILPFLLNLLGWNVYLTIYSAPKAYHFGCGQGVFHANKLEWEGPELFSDYVIPEEFLSEGEEKLDGYVPVKFSWMDVILEERIDEMTWFWFYKNEDGIGFPWWLLFPLPGLVLLIPLKKGKTEDSCGGQIYEAQDHTEE